MPESPSLLSPLLRFERSPSALELDKDATKSAYLKSLFSNKRFISLVNTILLIATLVMYVTMPVTNGERVTVAQMLRAKMASGQKSSGGQCTGVFAVPSKQSEQESTFARYTTEYLNHLYKANNIVNVGQASWWSVLLPRLQTTRCVNFKHVAVGEALTGRVDLVVWRDGLQHLTTEQVETGLRKIRDARPRIALLQSVPSTDGQQGVHGFDLTKTPFNLKAVRVFAEDKTYAKEGAVLLLVEDW